LAIGQPSTDLEWCPPHAGRGGAGLLTPNSCVTPCLRGGGEASGGVCCAPGRRAG